MQWTTGKKIIGMIAGVTLSVALLRGCVATSYLIPSAGMENSLMRGERILVNKWSYGLRLPWMRWIGYHRWGSRPVDKEDIIVFNNPANLEEPAIDEREIFINRCIGRPGDTLLVDSLFTAACPEQLAPDQKFLFMYPKCREKELDSLLHRLAIHSDPLAAQDTARRIRSFSRYEHYLILQALNEPFWLTRLGTGDSCQRLKPLVIPGKGMTVEVCPWNRTLLCNTLTLHEKRQAVIKHDTLFVDGKPTTRCRFSQDYYWVVSNNPANVADSRLFGLVPHSHIIGKASLIWLSKEKNRIGKTIH